MVPDVQAPAEYLKQPGLLAATVMGRSAPPMIAAGGSNGEEGPKSITNPVSLEELIHFTSVPAAIQNIAFDLAFGILGVEEAELLPRRLISIVHGVEAEPQVFPGLHIFSGFGSAQVYLSAADI